ncbi:nicotinate-nucleotide adenylyltransferase [Ferrimonas lipolytica]|uniref:Probable nicotinate-nucleotide adenylyltransferase n=1 Tax=Ferrimonas lipolytica TaxID=2724191 RepID=A0A6H1UEW5_9GAMM|nr:nicotinate-nucleotide adenylyltransferase [Ferrimonas lipolytica]QIZ77584.1 nicotinate-nucleotide adenylyltransferase [Ferrimonas lipolytica]
MRLGLFGGTFNPVHNGHLRCALEVQRGLELDRVDLLPNAIPPHKTSPGVSAEQRLAMVELACANHPQLTVDGRELNRLGNSYTVDTLAEIKAQQPQAQLHFIIGMDSLLNFHQWHQYQQILEFTHLIVCHRPGHQLHPSSTAAALLEKHQRHSVKALQQHASGGIFLFAATQLDIASSALREQMANGQAADFLLPPQVVDYIEQNQLYRS